MTLKEAFDLYRLDVIMFTNQSRKTEEHHEVALNSLLNYLHLNIQINELTFEMVRGWKTDLEMKGRSQGTIRGYIIRLRRVLAYMKRRGVICLDVELVQVPKRINRAPGFLSEDEVSRLIESAAQCRNRMYAKRNPAIIALLYSSGIRVSELVRMNITDTRYDTFTAFGKGNKSRPCFIDDRARKYIDDYLKARQDNSPALFISNEMKDRLSVSTIQLIMRNARKKAGIEATVTPHILRHSYATNFLRNNGNLRHLQVMMGHESIETTQMYTHVVDEDLKAIWKTHHSVSTPSAYGA